MRGYWPFVLGVLAGVVGIALAALGLLLLIVGPIVRLPLKRNANVLTYLGLVIGLAAIAWFFTAYPADWRRGAGLSRSIITVYAVGVALTAFGAVVVPARPGRTTTARRRRGRAPRGRTRGAGTGRRRLVPAAPPPRRPRDRR